MFTLYANSEDSELKTKVEELILNLYTNYCDNNNNCFRVYYEKALNIIENNENNSENIKIFGIIILSLLLNIKVDFIDINKIIKALNSNIEEEIKYMEQYIQNKMNNYDYLLMKDNDKIKLNQNKKEESKDNKDNDNDRWNILYQILSCIERLFNNYINKTNSSFKIQKNNTSNIISLFDNIIQASIHPHTFIKIISRGILYTKYSITIVNSI